MKYLYIHTTGPDAPARSATPFQLATAAAMLGNDATLVFAMQGSQLLQPGVPEALKANHEMPPLRHFIDLAKESGVQLLVCSGSLDVTGLKPGDLIEGVDGIVGGVTVNELAAESDVVMVF